MKSDNKTLRYVYNTQGICPPEIHFQIEKGILKEVRFVGGGCPGNAQLVSRFLKDKPLNEVLGLLKDINCRNSTSCPDQFAEALDAAKNGSLKPARSFRVYTDPLPRHRIGLIGDLEGNIDILKTLTNDMDNKKVEAVYCLGNLTGNSLNNKDLIRFIRKKELLAIQGVQDWQYAEGKEDDHLPPLDQKERDYLVRLPQVLSFHIGNEKGIAFFGKYIQGFPGFSDFEPFALEINMVCDLTSFMQDETVFPALKALLSQFEAQVILFSQIKKWGHWQIKGADFISVGPASNGAELSWGMLERVSQKIEFNIIKV